MGLGGSCRDGMGLGHLGVGHGVGSCRVGWVM